MFTVGIIVYKNVSLTPKKVINNNSDLKYIQLHRINASTRPCPFFKSNSTG